MKTITVPTVSKTKPPEPRLEHAIRLRAYDLYAQRGMAEGRAVDDWLAAEAELVYGHSTSDSKPSWVGGWALSHMPTLPSEPSTPHFLSTPPTMATSKCWSKQVWRDFPA